MTYDGLALPPYWSYTLLIVAMPRAGVQCSSRGSYVITPRYGGVDSAPRYGGATPLIVGFGGRKDGAVIFIAAPSSIVLQQQIFNCRSRTYTLSHYHSIEATIELDCV